MIKKLRSKAAMTLTELLVAMAIMSMVFAAVAVGISVAASSLRTMTLSSEASVLCDTLLSAVSDELRYATEPRTVDDGVRFNSKSYGSGVTVKSTPDGRIVLVSDEKIHHLLGDKAYSNGLSAEVEVEYSDANGLFEVKVWAYTADEPASSWAEAKVRVRAVNYHAA